MAAIDTFLQAFLRPGQGRRPLHRLPVGSAWMLFANAEGAFRLLLRRGYSEPDFRYRFLEDHPDVWQDALTRGAMMLPSSDASAPGKELWIVVDQPASPGHLLVLEIPEGFGASPDFFRFLFLAHLAELVEAREGLPSWLDRMLPAVLRSPSPVLFVSEEGSGCDRLIRLLLDQCFDGDCARFVPGRLAPSVQLREFYGDSTGERLRTSAVVPVAERSKVTVIREVADLAPELQLRILSDLSAFSSDRTWIFETSRDLTGMARAGQFDPALADLLGKVALLVPPLRKCRPEIAPEAERYLRILFGRYNRQVVLSDDARGVLEEYDWPGNLAELHATLEAAYLMSREGIIRPADLKPGLWHRSEPDDLNLRRRTEDMEMQLILQAHALHGGNQVHMARALGISRGSLQYRLNRIGLGE